MNGNLNGILPIFKETGFTSHDVVAKLRGILKTKKIGHSGTLDPNATGALPICIGKATKISDYMMLQPKEYIAEITFGIETATEDIWGEVLNYSDKIPTRDEIISSIDKINNQEIQQIPPMYSAKKIKGKKLYEYARKGEIISREPIRVTVYQAELLRKYENKALIRIRCSKGTYIRTLLKDLARSMDTCGTMSFLLRTLSSGISIDNCLTLEQIEHNIESIEDIMLPMEKALSHLPKIEVDDEKYKLILNGAKISTSLDPMEQNLIYCRNEFIGIGEVLKSNHSNIIKVKKLLH